MTGRAGRFLWALWALALVGLWLGLGVGSSGWQPPRWPGTPPSVTDPVLAEIVWNIRAPRTLGALCLGALLGLAGALAQGLFRNPLAEPYLLGSSSGAALSMALWLTVGLPWASLHSLQAVTGRLGLNGAAFVGALGGVALTLVLARGALHTLRLLLAGVVVGVVLGAVTQWLMLWSGEAWRAMQAFMLGNTALLGWPAVQVMAGVLCITLPASWWLARVLDALSLGEDTARTLGIPLGALRAALVGLMALATAAAVAQAGLVAFVGLVSPHLVRHRVGASHRGLLLAASLMGAVLLLAADLASRCLLAPQELPVGVLTAVLGGVYLLGVMYQHPRRSP